MTKYAQNHVAESRFTLPVVMVYAIVVWLASGLPIPAMPLDFTELWKGGWGQFVCFLVSTFLMATLNNNNALIRIYSRTMSCAFVVLMCAGCFLFSSMSGAFVQVCSVAVWLALFQTYQDKASVGWSYYAFLCVGLVSCIFIQILFFVPLLWFLMFYHLGSLSWRTFFASVLGLLTPYWFALPLLFYQDNAEMLAAHFTALIDFQQPFTDSTFFTVNELLLFVFIVGLGITGTVHYQRKRLGDNIRIRLFYNCFILMWIASAVLLVLQPQHYDALIRLLIINVSPLIAHFLTFTNTRVTNIAFHAICAIALLMTIFNLWMPSLLF